MVETYEVAPDMQALAAAGLSVADLASAINAGNRNDGAGRLPTGEEALIVRSTGAIRTLDDLRTWCCARPAGVLRVGDVAKVRIGALTRYGAVTHNGRARRSKGW
jgi:cobalt-zinc-cadmium resistance protein CzcA